VSLHPRSRLVRALSGASLAALTLGLTAGVTSSASAATTYAATYSNAGAITILDNASADPYPSTITVPSGGAVTGIGDVSVTLNGLTHSFVGDLDVVVVSPHGTPVYLLCGQQVGGKDDVSNVDVTFSSDGAGAPECADPEDASDLDDLALENPAGEWELYVDDYADGDDGQIARGWSVSFNQAAAPTVTTEPRDVFVTAGQPGAFTAHASGAPKPSVVWQSSTDGGTTWTDYAGENRDNFYPAPPLSDDGRLVRAEFTNQAGTTHTRAATMHVFAGPSAPLDLKASQTDEQTARLNWSVPATGAGGLAGYRVTAVSGSKTVERNVSSMQTFLNLPLEPGATYMISVFAHDDTTEGPAATTTLTTRRWPTLSVSKTSAVAGDALVIRGTGLPNETLRIEKTVLGSYATKDLVVTADANGAFQVTTRADRSSTYQVVTSAGLLSPWTNVKVAWKTTMAAKRVSARKYKFYGTLAPVTAGVPVKISYKKSNGAYAQLGTVRTGSTGKWAFTKRFSASKTMVFKASVAATTSNTAGSKLLTVKVR
jgi:subtilisin-like proprotein convertase family protein